MCVFARTERTLENQNIFVTAYASEEQLDSSTFLVKNQTM